MTQIPKDIAQETFKETIDFIKAASPNHNIFIKKREYYDGVTKFSYVFRKIADRDAQRLELIRTLKRSGYISYYNQRDKT